MADTSQPEYPISPSSAPGPESGQPAIGLLLRCLCASAVLVIGCVYQGSVAAGDQVEQLKQLRERIGILKEELASMRGERDSLQEALQQAETEIGAVAAGLHQLDTQAVQARQEIGVLEAERRREREHLEDMRAILARELRSAYIGGRQEHIKLLLNQEDPAMLARMLVYHGYFTQARAGRMQEVRETLARLDRIEAELVEQQAAIERLRGQQRKESLRLAAEQEKRRRVLAQLETGLQHKTSELGALEQDEKRLQQLVESLQQALRDIPAPAGEDQSLASLKGRLHWPVAGRIAVNYGERHASGKLRSRGVHITTAAGAEVQAIAKGRVAFADWLRGFGLLLIIDHGGGYMSLYGQNRSLYKDVGEWVTRGEIIAAAGNSGGQTRTGLYLELRKDGRPFNPGSWFAGKPADRQQASR
ncbi:MAG: peptidoglycan DD-metalloendopeptidase family protein [Gammaproteobacteria bacterium]